MSAVSAPGVFVGGGVADASTPSDVAAARDEILAKAAGAIVYSDEGSQIAATASKSTGMRVATVACTKCGSKFEQHQTRAASGDWIPDVPRQLGIFGWQTDGDRWFCGKWCAQMYAHQVREHGNQPLPTVTRVNDATYARRMYAEPLAGTTPAAPPKPAAARAPRVAK